MVRIFVLLLLFFLLQDISDAETRFYYLSKDGKSDLHICIAPKVGTTSLFSSLHQVIVGNKFQGPIHLVQNWHQWPSPSELYMSKKPHESPNIEKRLSFWVTRDPLERYISAFFSKLVCCDGRHSSAQRPIKREGCMSDKISNADQMSIYFTESLGYSGKTCLYFSEYVTALQSFKNSNNELSLNNHFKPQSMFCPINNSHVLFEGNIEDTFASLRTMKDFDFENIKYAKLHASDDRRQRHQKRIQSKFEDNDMKILCEIAKTDYIAMRRAMPQQCSDLGVE